MEEEHEAEASAYAPLVKALLVGPGGQLAVSAEKLSCGAYGELDKQPLDALREQFHALGVSDACLEQLVEVGAGEGGLLLLWFVGRASLLSA